MEKKKPPPLPALRPPPLPPPPSSRPVSRRTPEKLGFAGRLPADTEFYVGSADFKQHLEALKKSAFYKEISALANDKTPGPGRG